MNRLDYICQGGWLTIQGTKYKVLSLRATEIVTQSPGGYETSHNLEYAEYMVRRGYWQAHDA